MIVIVEGLPGAGKTSLIERLLHEKSYTSVAEMLVSPAVEKSFSDADYTAHDRRKYRVAQRFGASGVCFMDRGELSSVAYRYASGTLSLQAALAVKIQQPDYYIYLRISPADSMRRRGAHSASWSTGKTFTMKLSAFYDHYFAMPLAGTVITIDASLPAETIIKTVHQTLEQQNT